MGIVYCTPVTYSCALGAERMNDSQVAAVVASLRRTLTLIQGPPGTGKTRTLARLLAAATHVMSRGQILAAAASNVAVDNLVTKLLELGVKVIRVGQPVKVTLGSHIRA